MDQFDLVFTLDGGSSSPAQSAVASPPGTPIVPVILDPEEDVPDLTIEDIPMDYDHRSSGFAAYCVIA